MHTVAREQAAVVTAPMGRSNSNKEMEQKRE